MDKPEGPAATEHAPGIDLPPGDHPLEVAARRGIGPLSHLVQDAWHGNARPCVSCGMLVLRDQRECDHCGQDLSDEMLRKMRAHAGPWYVLEHLRPFPGVSLERLIRQIRRGVLTETSIVRGPATDFQWRFAMETPGLCRYFGRCWHCHEAVSGSDTYCPHCLTYLSFDAPHPARAAPLEAHPDARPRGANASGAPSRAAASSGTARDKLSRGMAEELRELSAALGEASTARRDAIWDEPPRIGPIRATWIAVLILILVITALLWVTRTRQRDSGPPQPDRTALLAPALGQQPMLL